MKPIIDLHTDLIHSYLKFGNPQLFKEVRKQMTISSLKKSGVKLFFAGLSGDDENKDTFKQIQLYRDLFKKNNINLVLGVSDIKNILNSRSSILHIEGGELIKDLECFDKFYALGIRSVGLAFSEVNRLACGATINTKDDFGLTRIGKLIVKKCNLSGVIVDLAHASEKTFKQTLNTVNKPPIITHTACRALLEHPRNTSDKQIKEIAKNGGLIGIFFSKKFISNQEKVGTIEVLKHFVHVADLVGTKYLAIGSDFAGISKGTPDGLEGYSKLSFLLKSMRKVGFSKNEVEDIAFNNVYKYLKQVLI